MQNITYFCPTLERVKEDQLWIIAEPDAETGLEVVALAALSCC